MSAWQNISWSRNLFSPTWMVGGQYQLAVLWWLQKEHNRTRMYRRRHQKTVQPWGHLDSLWNSSYTHCRWLSRLWSDLLVLEGLLSGMPSMRLIVHPVRGGTSTVNVIRPIFMSICCHSRAPPGMRFSCLGWRTCARDWGDFRRFGRVV